MLLIKKKIKISNYTQPNITIDVSMLSRNKVMQPQVTERN